jgi:hypothetical protein
LFSDTYFDKWNDCFCLFDGKDNDNDMRRLENSSWLVVSSWLSFVESRWSWTQGRFNERLIRWNVINKGYDWWFEQRRWRYSDVSIGQVTR